MHSLKKPAVDTVNSLASGPAFEALLVDVRERARAGEFDRQRHISQDVIEAFKQHGVYRALVPKRFGGLECSPAEFCQVIER
ncbi:acyl-CoA dehydrogenase family protein, partial [Pseudomonas sp.]|nr:flavin-dependent monooxygenase [Pseudomonas sp.]